MIYFLCSDFGRHVSAQIIGVDGNAATLYPRRQGTNNRVGIVYIDRLLLAQQACGRV